MFRPRWVIIALAVRTHYKGMLISLQPELLSDVRRRARLQKHRDASFHQVLFPPVRQGPKWNSRHSDKNIRRTCTIVCHRQKLGGPVSTWWFFNLCVPCPGRPKTV